MSISWYLRRLRAMTASEVFFRLRLAVRKSTWKLMQKFGRTYGLPASELLPAFFAEPRPVWGVGSLAGSGEAQELVDEAEAYLRHEWRFWGRTDCVEECIDWHYDPSTEIRAPLDFGFDIDHRDAERVGDIKWIWEKNRHHHLTVLALAFALTEDDRFSSEVESQMLSWLEQNPPLFGVNWTHPLEQGIRLISWVWCERLLRGSKAHERLFGENSELWTSIHAHQQFIEDTFCRGSSANNHVIGEMAGLYVASLAFPVFKESVHWQSLAKSILEEQLPRQTFPSGLNREMAFPYHFFVFEFAIAAYAEAERAGDEFSRPFEDALCRMIEVVPPLTAAGGGFPRYGDSDEGRAIQLQASSARRDDWLYRVAASLLRADVPFPADGQLASSVLLAGLEPLEEVSESVESDGSVGFEDAGVYVLASNRGMAKEVMVIADAGPHGFLSIAAHGHADALSFVLSAGGKEIFVDPGTFVYYAQPDWRSYFRSVWAHNTIVVDGEDQSAQEGPMMWGRRAKTRVLSWKPTEDGGELEAEHDGYGHLGVAHRRSFNLRGERLDIVDCIEGVGIHDLQLRLHLHPECRLQRLAGRSAHVSRGQINIEITLPETVKLRIVKGGDDAGWYSPAYSVKQETTTLIGEIHGELPLELITSIEAHC